MRTFEANTTSRWLLTVTWYQVPGTWYQYTTYCREVLPGTTIESYKRTQTNNVVAALAKSEDYVPYYSTR